MGLVGGVCHAGETKLPDLAETKLAAERGDAKAQLALAWSYKSHSDNDTAEKWYKLAAQQGLAEAEYDYGAFLKTDVVHHENGKAVIRKADPSQAFQWFMKAANHNHRAAFVRLAESYRDGKVVKQDYVEAYKYFTIAEKLGDIFAKGPRDALILKMTSDQIADGQSRAEAMKLGTTITPATK